jgi:predicted ribosomally synthesized peptide with nif11-like leader
MSQDKKKTDSSEFLAEVARSPELQKEMSAVRSPQEILAIAKKAGYELDNHALSASMRAIAAKALQPHGLPHWAIDSMFLGEAVCW